MREVEFGHPSGRLTYTGCASSPPLLEAMTKTMWEYGPEIECSGEQDTGCIAVQQMMHVAIYSMLDLELSTGGIPDERHDNHDSAYRARNCARGILKITISWPTLTRVHSAHIGVSSAERS